MKKAILYTPLEHDTVRCTACAHYCTIAESKWGRCKVRGNREGILYLDVYGEVVAENVDPIEKKPLYHFLPGSSVFSIGTYGCNFTCDYCQNWSISQTHDDIRHHSASLTPERIVEYCIQHELPAIAFTYNEPTIFSEFVYDIAVLARKEGIRSVLVSNGYMSSEAVTFLAPVIDAINIDLKADSDFFYKNFCHGGYTQVLKTIEAFRKQGVWVEVTTLVIPGRNDADQQLRNIADALVRIDRGVPWHLSAFHPDYKALDVEPTSQERLESAYTIGKEQGLIFVYLGNVADVIHQSTYCSECNSQLIERSWNSAVLGEFELGKCNHCGKKLPGVWE
ncbi:MAG: AmmeMemoRadiSam system radical SAM enzyme [Fibrobacterales bacterium]